MMLKSVLRFQICKITTTKAARVSGIPCDDDKKSVVRRQYITSIPIIAYGKVFPR